jgi:hypothetical protein
VTPRTFVVRAAAYDRVRDARRDYDALARAGGLTLACVHDAVLLERSRNGRARAVKALAGVLLSLDLFDVPSDEPTPIAGLFWCGMSVEGRRRLRTLARAGEAWLIVIAAAPVWQGLQDFGKTALVAFEETLSVYCGGYVGADNDGGLSAPRSDFGDRGVARRSSSA